MKRRGLGCARSASTPGETMTRGEVKPSGLVDVLAWGGRSGQSGPEQGEEGVHTLGPLCAGGWDPSKVTRT